MPREKSPGLKILWLWTIGTAAILVTSVVRTRMRDMESLMIMNAEQQNHHQKQQNPPTESLILDSEVIREEKS
ncbi:basic leucine zipper/W2 domain protein [Parasponia andersonii]|uniref:Basic leucine zipper/W2 domain protein n=1 Tax=Parasponia andersonii TaxID=3476 RepID=A0A2P5CDM6_PARAD|nr:basic leucine zipper/W2 domain protein [Parasponia andersonii]